MAGLAAPQGFPLSCPRALWEGQIIQIKCHLWAPPHSEFTLGRPGNWTGKGWDWRPASGRSASSSRGFLVEQIKGVRARQRGPCRTSPRNDRPSPHIPGLDTPMGHYIYSPPVWPGWGVWPVPRSPGLGAVGGGTEIASCFYGPPTKEAVGCGGSQGPGQRA